MRLFKLLVVASLFSCSQDKIVDVKLCGRECFTGKDSLSGVGACKPGVWECDSDLNPIACVGQTLPSKEVCDGQDNDCNGKTDEFILKRDCSSACGTGFEFCTNGSWQGCTATQPVSEVCDRQDNDCDGLIDEVEDLSVSLCYTGPQKTVGFGACMPGVTRCVNGSSVCWGEVTPQKEICDGKDNDCDGELDESINNVNIDLLVIIDNSCSMGPVIDNVKLATQSWSLKYGNRPEIKFGLLAAPGVNQDGWDVIKVRDLTNVTNFNAGLALQTGITNTPDEATLDALQMISLPSNPLNLSWSLNSKKIAVVFSDEVPQSYIYDLPTTYVASNLANSKVVTHVFTSDIVFQEWSPITSMSGGYLSDIKKKAFDIEQNLDKIIQKASCTP